MECIEFLCNFIYPLKWRPFACVIWVEPVDDSYVVQNAIAMVKVLMIHVLLRILLPPFLIVGPLVHFGMFQNIRPS